MRPLSTRATCVLSWMREPSGFQNVPSAEALERHAEVCHAVCTLAGESEGDAVGAGLSWLMAR